MKAIRSSEIIQLLVDGLYSEGANAKQLYLERLAAAIGFDLAMIRRLFAERGWELWPEGRLYETDTSDNAPEALVRGDHHWEEGPDFARGGTLLAGTAGRTPV